jgi:hypothetical protein
VAALAAGGATFLTNDRDLPKICGLRYLTIGFLRCVICTATNVLSMSPSFLDVSTHYLPWVNALGLLGWGATGEILGTADSSRISTCALARITVVQPIPEEPLITVASRSTGQ